MRLFNSSPLWAVNKVAQNLCRRTSWRPLLLPAMFWLGICSGNSCMQNIRDVVMRLTRSALPASSPRLAVSRKGEALALWCEGWGGSQGVWGNMYHPEAGWMTPRRLGSAQGDERESRAALNSHGEATLLWVETVGRTRHLLAASYHPERGWGSPTVLDSTGLALSPQVLLDDEGNSLASWHRYESADHSYHLLSARRTTSGWGSTWVIGKDQLVPTGGIAGNGAGKVVALWNAATPGGVVGELRHNTWVRLFDPRDGWGAARPLGREIVQGDLTSPVAQTMPGHHAPVLAMDRAGNVLAAWQEVSAPGRDFLLRAVRFDIEKGWGEAEPIGENPLAVSAALSDDGIAFVCLTQGANWPDVDAYLSSLTVSTNMGLGWFPEKVLDNYPYFCLSPSLVLAQDGQPLVTWLKGSGEERELWGASRTVTGWRSPNRLDEVGAVDQYEAGADDAGNVIVVWTEQSGQEYSVWGRTVQG